MFNAVHECFDLSLYSVEIAPYRSLRLVDRSFPHWILSYVSSAMATLL